VSTGLTFKSTSVGNGDDNPTNPEEMTDDQKNRAVTVDYVEKSWWRLKFDVISTSSSSTGGRNLLFAGVSDLVPTPAPTPVPTPTTTVPKQTTTTTTLSGDGKCVDCVVWGDPHIITFDLNNKRRHEHPNREAFFRTRNWKLDELNLYEEGNFWLVKSEQVYIQGKYVKNATHPEFTSLGALAVGGPFLKGSTMVFSNI
jgi:hypothetical protein